MHRIALILAVVALLAIGGCGGGGGGHSSVGGDSFTQFSNTSIGSSGGVARLASVGEVEFTAGALSLTQPVTVGSTVSAAESQAYAETGAIFQPVDSAGYQVRILLKQQPATETVRVSLDIPADLLNVVSSSIGIHIFARVYETGGQEVLDNYQLLSSTYDATNRKAIADVTAAAFSKTRRTDGLYEAVFMLAVVPGGNVAMRTAGAPQAAYIGSPLAGTLTVNSPFGPRTFNGEQQFHYGVDFATSPDGTDVYAAADGVIEQARLQTINGDEQNPVGTGYGLHLVLRHSDGSATLYAHLSVLSVEKGDPITKGSKIGVSGGVKGAPGSGTSSGPHLHFEYVPSGAVYRSPNRVDPYPCIRADDQPAFFGGILVADNGPANDDVFAVYLDGVLLGRTPKGGSDTFGANNLRPGPKTLRVYCEDDGWEGGDVGTLGITLGEGLVFEDGSTALSDELNWRQEKTYTIIVPSASRTMSRGMPAMPRNTATERNAR